MNTYTCCSCGSECRKKIGPCKGCELQVFTNYTGDYCGCRGNWLIGGSAITSYECKMCGRKESHSNTNTPIICYYCSHSQQCIYCGRKGARNVFSIRRQRFMDFYAEIKNTLRNGFPMSRKNRVPITEEYQQETEDYINEFYKPL